MAYQAKHLSVLTYANGFTLWHYTTPDTAAAIDTTGYFNEAAAMMRKGDFMLANVETGGTPKAGLFVVADNAAGVVDVTDMNQFGATDTD